MTNIDTEIAQATALLAELQVEKSHEHTGATGPATGPTGPAYVYVAGPTGGTLNTHEVSESATLSTHDIPAPVSLRTSDVWPWGHDATGKRNVPPADVPSSGGTGSQDGNATMHQIMNR